METRQVYGIGGELLAEYAPNGAPSSPQKEYGYRNGELLITATVTTSWGTPPAMADNPLQVGVTVVKAQHISELRSAINALRSHMSMSAYSWQYSATTSDYISANPIIEMRTALDHALGAPSGGYAAGLAPDQPVKAVHIQELRDRVLAAWVSGSSTDIRWLLTDHLGTPRMIFDQTGNLANISRHDYLPFGEDVPTNFRTGIGGYGTTDNVRQKFTSKERDNETGLDFSDARYYASTLGRFTSTDPIFITENRLVDPQQINLYHYARNNPLRFTDPTGEDIDDSSLKDSKDYQKWKKAFLATKSGRAQWDKFNNDHNVKVTIKMGTNSGGKGGAETTPTFDANGKLSGATIVLGTDFANDAPTHLADNYPVLKSLTPTDGEALQISREARAVAFLSHELGHVEDAQRVGGAIWQRQNQLIEQHLEGYRKQGQAYFKSKEYQELVSQLGGTPVQINAQRENRAEGYAVPVIREYFGKGAGHGSMPKRVKQAIQNYEKSNPR